MATRDELIAAITDRYLRADKTERSRILDEFTAVSGFHRKHAMRLLRVGQPKRRSGPRPDRRIYDDATREALIVIWEASDRICGKRLRPLVPVMVEAMERHGHLSLAPEIRISLLAMSAATIDRALRAVKNHAGGSTRRKAVPSAAIKRAVPVRTFDGWDNPSPGFVEADLVSHGGAVAKGSFVQTLVLTDIATGWTECARLLVREQRLLTEVLGEMRKLLPFTLLGFDTDNDSVFMNETVRDYCLATSIEFTRCRPYRKNDQAWVEQKNGSVVRRTVGYRRFEGLQAATMLARLYAALRLYVNFYQPSFKLATKARDGAKVMKRYHPPATPCERLIADARTSEEVRQRLTRQRATLDPVRLLQEIRTAQQELVRLADATVLGETTPPTAPTLEQFLSGLRTAWQEGEVRPTSTPKPKAKRLRRRPDPLAAVTLVLRGWFEAEPWRTSRELLERLQSEYPGLYPNQLLRTCQRRLKEWRREAALQLVFGTSPADVINLGSTKQYSAPTGESDRPGDLPLRLDAAAASPTTPQDPQQRQVSFGNEKVAISVPRP